MMVDSMTYNLATGTASQMVLKLVSMKDGLIALWME